MYIIMVYDVNTKRISKVLKIARKYLTWVQNSVLEGEITPANFERLKLELLDVLDREEDSIIFYKLRTTKYMTKEVLGIKKGEPSTII